MKDSPCPRGSRDKWGEQNHNQCNDYCDEGVWGWVAWTHRVGVPDPALGVREGSVKGRGWSIFQGWGMSLGKAPEINMPYIYTSKSFWAKCFILPLTSQCCFELPEKLKKKMIHCDIVPQHSEEVRLDRFIHRHIFKSMILVPYPWVCLSDQKKKNHYSDSE